jgi:hypothetical protein
LGDFNPRSPRETSADVFLEPKNGGTNLTNNLLSLTTMRNDCPEFDV